MTFLKSNFFYVLNEKMRSSHRKRVSRRSTRTSKKANRTSVARRLSFSYKGEGRYRSGVEPLVFYLVTLGSCLMALALKSDVGEASRRQIQDLFQRTQMLLFSGDATPEDVNELSNDVWNLQTHSDVSMEDVQAANPN